MSRSHAESSSSEHLDLDEVINNEYKRRSRRHRKKQRQRAKSLTPAVVVQLYLKSITNRLDSANFVIFDIVEENMVVMILQYIDIGAHFRSSYAIAIGQCGIQMSLQNQQTCARSPIFYVDTMQRGVLAANHRAVTAENSEFPDPKTSALDGTGNNFAKGRYSDAAYFLDHQLVMERIRKQIEQHDNYLLQGVEVVHSIGGGTGSGMGCLVLHALNDMYYGGKFTVSSFTTFPSDKVSDVVVEPYNALLALEDMKDVVDQVFVMDNEALLHHARARYATSRHGVRAASYVDLNAIANNAMNGVRKLWHCPQSGWTARAVHKELSLRSHRTLKYFTMSQQIPLSNVDSSAYSCYDVFSAQPVYSEYCCYANLLSTQPFLARLEDDGTFMKAICALHVNQKTAANKQKKKLITKKLLKTEARLSVEGTLHEKCHLNPTFVAEAKSTKNADDTFCSVSMIVHHSGIVKLFEVLLAQHMRMWKRRAFFHWYRGEGMDVEEFEAAQENARTIIEEYHSI